MKKTILIAEDDRKIAAALTIRLQAMGYEVVVMADAYRSFMHAVTDRPDVILMDIGLPFASGLSVANEMKRTGLAGIPIIFMTASGQDALRQQAEKLGAVAFFEKPFDTGKLLAAVERAGSRKRQQKSLRRGARGAKSIAPQNQKILIVEDDKKTAAALAIRLNGAGYTALTASDGIVGLELALSQRPDLVLMDLWLPGAMGFSIAEKIQKHFPHLPIIFITACKKNDLWAAAQEMGAFDFIEKPFDMEQLLGVISHALASASSSAKKPASRTGRKKLSHAA